MANEPSPARNEPNWRFIARLRMAGMLVVMGLLLQVGTLFKAHPYSFMLFLVFGIGLVAIGVLAFIWAWIMQ